ncbi:MAG: hypothetical protein RLZZ618_929 [Pseudomonadota bacterium]|jgi:REP element-mobilizing transposase RayT
MARPLRIEFPGATYHVTSRGDRREPIFVNDEDRHGLLNVVSEALARFDASMLAYCLMGNHYHFVLHTRQANLSRVMRHINGVYTQAFNAQHGKVGHLFQGRFTAILVDEDAYLMEVCRYVELNPVRARMVERPEDWPWSSYLAHICKAPSPSWLDTDGLHEYLLGREVGHATDRQRAVRLYAELVASAPDQNLWTEALRQQIFLGDDAFVEKMQALAEKQRQQSRDIPSMQRSSPKTLDQWLASCKTKEDALINGYQQSGLTMTDMARQLKISVSSVSRIIRLAEEKSSSPQKR